MQGHRWRFPTPDAEAARRALDRSDQLTKPRGSLGALERLPAKLAAIQGTALPEVRPAAALRGCRAAFIFLTRIPVGGFPYTPLEWRWSTAWFPFVGAVLGIVMAGAFSLFRPTGALPGACRWHHR